MFEKTAETAKAMDHTARHNGDPHIETDTNEPIALAL